MAESHSKPIAKLREWCSTVRCQAVFQDVSPLAVPRLGMSQYIGTEAPSAVLGMNWRILDILFRGTYTKSPGFR
jgi:hypothetical protein